MTESFRSDFIVDGNTLLQAIYNNLYTRLLIYTFVFGHMLCVHGTVHTVLYEVCTVQYDGKVKQ